MQVAHRKLLQNSQVTANVIVDVNSTTSKEVAADAEALAKSINTGQFDVSVIQLWPCIFIATCSFFLCVQCCQHFKDSWVQAVISLCHWTRAAFLCMSGNWQQLMSCA